MNSLRRLDRIFVRGEAWRWVGGWMGRGEREGRILSNRERGKGGGGRIKRAVIPEFIISLPPPPPAREI